MSSGKGKNNKPEALRAAVFALFACWAVVLLSGWSVRDPLSVFSFTALFILFIYEGRIRKKEGSRERLIAAALFTLVTVLVKYTAVSEAFDSGLFKAASILILSAGCFLLFTALINSACELLNKADAGSALCRKEDEKIPAFLKKHLLLCSFAFCLLCYLPWFLYSFPGIFDPDPINQIEQILGVAAPSDHHPYAHTLVISLFYHIGSIFSNDINIAIGFYTFFQMSLFAFAAALCVYTLYRYLRLRFGICMVVLAFYALLPFMAVHAILVCKDTVFASALMIFCCMLTAMIYEGKIRIPVAAGFILSGIAVCLMRTNGFYAFLIFIPFFIIVFRKQWKTVIALILPVIIFVLLVKGPIYRAIGVQKGDLVESLHVPMQQIACVIARGREIEPREKQLIEELCSYEQIPDRYIPWLADSIKELIRAGHPDVLEEKKADYLGLWIRLGLRYPKDYIDAWTGLTENIIYPDGDYDVAVIEGVFGNDIGLEWRPVIGGGILLKLREILLKLGSFIPVYGFLWSMGSYCWVFMFFAAYLLQQRRQRRRIIILMPAFGLIFTLFLAIPVGKYFRYAYSYAVLLPFVFCTMAGIADRDKADTSNQKKKSLLTSAK